MAHRKLVGLLIAVFALSLLGSTHTQPVRAVQSFPPTTGLTNEAVIEVQFPYQNPPLLITQNQTVLNSLQGQVQYYYNASYGQLKINYKFFGPFNLPRPELFYGQDSGGIDPNKLQLICDSLNAAEQGGVPLAQYQHITIVHAGSGQEATHNTNDIYSSWFGFNRLCTDSNGLQIPTTRVIVISESSPVGTYCHEFGHDNGLPDIYDLNSANGGDDFIGPWSLMAAGNWLGLPAGSSPGSFDSWSKTQLGWIKPSQIVTVSNATANVTIGALELANQATYAVKIPLTSTTYYLLESRRAVGVDNAIPSQGVLVLLVDESNLGNYCYISPCFVSGVVLVEPHPNQNLNAAPLPPGQSFADPQKRVFIKVLGQTGSGYRVQITAHMLFVTLLGPLQVAATQNAPYTVHVTDENGTAKRGIQVTLSLDGRTLRQVTTDLAGNATLQITYNWTDIGFHTLTIQTQAITNYIDGSQKATVQVVLPTSAYPILAAIIVVPLGIVVLRRHKHTEFPEPSQWSSTPAYSIPTNFCPQCGQPVTRGTSYCMTCGTRFN